MSTKGIYKIFHPDLMENDAQISDCGNNEIPIPESLYRERGYKPDYDDLPTFDEYQNKK